MSAVVIAGMNTVGFAITALTKSHKITDLTVRTCLLAMLNSAALDSWHCRYPRGTFSHSAGLPMPKMQSTHPVDKRPADYTRILVYDDLSVHSMNHLFVCAHLADAAPHRRVQLSLKCVMK